jgi:dTDP-4-amino-4,6-dideoxygalactose transaminase
MIHALRKLLSHVYIVPWCVPPWGWREFSVTCGAWLGNRPVHGLHSAKAAAAVKDYLGKKHVLAVNRGGSAIELALRALGLGTADEVVLPSYLCRSVLDAVHRAGARPVFADIGPDLNVTAQTVLEAITGRTRCVIVPHLFGKAAPIDEIETRLRGSGIAIIDDAAQALGARCSGRLLGTFGACGIIGCGPAKPLAGPAGGLLVTDNEGLFARAAAIALATEPSGQVRDRALAFWTWRRWRRYTLPVQLVMERILGPAEEPPHRTAALSNLDAGLMVSQLAALERNAAVRRRNAARLAALIDGVLGTCIPNWSPADVATRLVLVLPEKGPTAKEAIQRFARAGVECQDGYAPLHLEVAPQKRRLPQTERLFSWILWVPVESPVDRNRLLRETIRPWRS